MDKQFILIAFLAGFIILPGCRTKYEYPFQDPDLSVDERIENLLGLLTLKEKTGLMVNSSEAVPRLGIPAYDWWNEALHGVGRAGLATVYPQAIGMAATWNEPAHLEAFTIISDEARQSFMKRCETTTGVGITDSVSGRPTSTFSVILVGEGVKTYGEDPFLTSRWVWQQ